jgi:hypothetical protein
MKDPFKLETSSFVSLNKMVLLELVFISDLWHKFRREAGGLTYEPHSRHNQNEEKILVSEPKSSPQVLCTVNPRNIVSTGSSLGKEHNLSLGGLNLILLVEYYLLIVFKADRIRSIITTALACELNSAESSAKRVSWASVKVEKPEVNILKSARERIVPCDTPHILQSTDLSPATVT